MTVHKLTAGDGYTYLSRQVAAHDGTEPDAAGLEAYYSDKGEAPGRWTGRGLAALTGEPLGVTVTEAQMLALFGRGRHPDAARLATAAQSAGMDPRQVDRSSRLGAPYLVFDAANEFRRRCAVAFRDRNTDLGLPSSTPVPVDERASIRTAVAIEMFVERFGRAPLNPRELSGHLARMSRQSTTAVAGYDLTFSPVKSVSTLWAVAPRRVAEVIEQAHADAVSDVLAWLEDNATYSRSGRQGVAQVDVRGLIAAAFTHRDSRAGDPDLHTHVAISNKVQTLDGRWLALDGRAIYKNNVAASERYNTRIEALLVDRLGVRFRDRPAADPGKRPVREIVGVDGPLPQRWSSRRAAIDARQAELASTFQIDHGRPPTAREAIALAQQANLETREAKHEPRSHADQRSTWRAEALAVLGGDDQLERYLDGALSPSAGPTQQEVTSEWLNRTARAVLHRVESGRATWQEAHIRAEAERRARAAGIRLGDLDRAVDGLVTTALSPQFSLRLGPVPAGDEPQALRRTDGTSVFHVAGSTLFTSTRVLAAERDVLAAAGRRDGHVTPEIAVDAALDASAADGIHLNPGQARLVHDLATSGSRVQLALAPAGTGKTTALRALAAAWRGGGGDVIGLAPSAAASAVLREQIGSRTDTLAKLVHAATTGLDVPSWLPTIGPRTLLVVDEAGAADTTELAALVQFAVATGASVRLVGDDQQLGAVGAGGLLHDLATTFGAVRLSQVVRFVHAGTGTPNRAEGAASLALRDGDPAALAYYADHDRLHVGDLGTCTDNAYDAWARDRAADRDALMLAPTRELVRQLNDRARRDRLARGQVTGPDVSLADSTTASAGDVVITRRNERSVTVGPTNWVKNGDRWTIAAVHPTGAADVVAIRTGEHVTLPADYVRAHVTLGYASTVHGAQGVTADRSYTIATGQESRQLLYVALTRGRHENHVFLTTVGEGDPHSAITRDALLPPTAVDLLTRVLDRDDSPTSATSAAAELVSPETRLTEGVDRYVHSLTTAAQERVGVAGLADIDALSESTLPGLTYEDAYPALRARLALLEVAGTAPSDTLRSAVSDPRGLDDARDPAAVLDWRLDPGPAPDAGPLPWLPAIPAPLGQDPVWGEYLVGRAAQIATLATAVAAAAEAWTPATAPPWARPLLTDPALVADLSVWRSALGVDDDRRPSGPRQPAAAEARAQRQLDARIADVLGHPGSDTARWAALARSVDPTITVDPFWPVLAERLTGADRAGIDVPALIQSVALRPLPDEQPAAALWWRLSDPLSPAVASPDAADREPLRPSWVTELIDLIGGPAADDLMGGPGWAALVAAVDEAGPCGWTPAQVLGAALDLLLSGRPDHDRPTGDDLAHGLLWRIRLLTDPRADTDNSPADWLVGLEGPDAFEPAPEGRDDATPAAAPPVTNARLLELNDEAAVFFTGRYPGSWARPYLIDRLGTDEFAHVVGYAPGEWTGLTEYLRSLGARDDEIVAAGLGTWASTGRVIDRFRDRVVFAIQSDDGIMGWIGRRNPHLDVARTQSVPKYLNTSETAIFVKGDELFGLTESRAALDRGAAPVLVEGPMDAVAVTLAGEGAFVGIAPLGTAFTDCQGDKLHDLTKPTRRPIVATDADTAGRKAAETMFWRLIERGADPEVLPLPSGADPADVLRTAGPDALRAALSDAPSLASHLVDVRIDAYADRLDTVEGQVHATRRAAEVVAALPSGSWPPLLTQVVARTGIAADIALEETIRAAERRPGGTDNRTVDPVDRAPGEVSRSSPARYGTPAHRPTRSGHKALTAPGVRR